LLGYVQEYCFILILTVKLTRLTFLLAHHKTATEVMSTTLFKFTNE